MERKKESKTIIKSNYKLDPIFLIKNLLNKII